MTKDDDLVKRLRKTAQSGKPTHVSKADRLAAADRIEALIERLEAARLDAKEAEAYSVWLEAKLAKVVEALDQIAGKVPFADDPYDIARATLAELKGETDK